MLSLIGHNLQSQHIPQPHLYTNLTYNNERYRIRTRQLMKITHAIGNLEKFWGTLMMVEIGVVGFVGLGVEEGLIGVVCMVLAACVSAVIGYQAFSNWRTGINWPMLIKLSLLFLYLTLCLTLHILTLPHLTIPTSIYICLQLLSSLKSRSSRSRMLPKFLLLLQLLVIMLKLDQKINAPWLEVYFGFIFVTFMGYVVMLSMALFLVVDVLYFRERVYGVKHVGIFYVFLAAVSIVLCSIMPVAQSFYNVKIWIIGILGIIFKGCVLGFGRKYRTQIIMFLSNVEKVKGFNQKVTLIKMINKCQELFIQKSQHWFQKISLDALKKQTKSSTKSQPQPQSTPSPFPLQSSTPSPSQSQLQSQNKCLICLQLQPCVIWMPCGHKTVCQICCDRMLQTKNCNCLLCKDLPQAIYFVQPIQNQQQQQKQEQISDSQQCKTQDGNSKSNFKSMSTKDLQAIENSLSGNVMMKQTNMMHKKGMSLQLQKLIKESKYKKGELFLITNSYSVKVQ